jgi:hypothetical protein
VDVFGLHLPERGDRRRELRLLDELRQVLAESVR